MTSQILSYWFAGGLLFCCVFLLSKPRLTAVLRLYAASSFFLAGLLASHAWGRGDWHAVWIAGLTLAVKVFLIPAGLYWVMRRSGTSFQVKFVTKPALTYILLFLLLAVSGVIASRLPVAQAPDERVFVFVSVSVLLLGLCALCLRRDVFSQIIGFLVFENGIAAFAAMVIGGLPLFFEGGLMLLIVLSVLLMAFLSKEIQQLYQSADTQRLTELTD